MKHSYIFQIFLLSLLLTTLIYGRALYYDELDEDKNTKSSSNEEDDDNNLSFDSYEERKFHERSIFSSSRPPHTIAAHSRQVLIDILQKAIDQGWKPNLKHYIPATRFGRH